MIDVAKIADLVLLLVDASFGFEMEIFEFLNICQVMLMEQYSSYLMCKGLYMLIPSMTGEKLSHAISIFFQFCVILVHFV
jgi:hypothetical protein